MKKSCTTIKSLLKYMLIILFALSWSHISVAKSQKRSPTQAKVLAQKSSGLKMGMSDSQKSFEIRGQSRNISMLLVLKNRNDSIDFVKPREHYQSEISKTSF